MRLLPIALLAVVLAACDTVGDGARIVRYDGPTITEANAAVANPPFEPAGWRGYGFLGYTRRSVRVERTVTCGDECSQTVRFSFEAAVPGGELPESVTGVTEVVNHNPDGVETTALTVDRVEIQDWGPEVYSGVVTIDHGSADIVPARIVFWTDDVSTAVE